MKKIIDLSLKKAVMVFFIIVIMIIIFLTMIL